MIRIILKSARRPMEKESFFIINFIVFLFISLNSIFSSNLSNANASDSSKNKTKTRPKNSFLKSSFLTSPAYLYEKHKTIYDSLSAILHLEKDYRENKITKNFYQKENGGRRFDRIFNLAFQSLNEAFEHAPYLSSKNIFWPKLIIDASFSADRISKQTRQEVLRKKISILYIHKLKKNSLPPEIQWSDIAKWIILQNDKDLSLQFDNASLDFISKNSKSNRYILNAIRNYNYRPHQSFFIEIGVALQSISTSLLFGNISIELNQWLHNVNSFNRDRLLKMDELIQKGLNGLQINKTILIDLKSYEEYFFEIYGPDNQRYKETIGRIKSFRDQIETRRQKGHSPLSANLYNLDEYRKLLELLEPNNKVCLKLF